MKTNLIGFVAALVLLVGAPLGVVAWGSHAGQASQGKDDYRLEGPFFFGAAEKLEAALARSLTIPRVVILRMRNVPAIDATGLRAIEIMVERFRRKQTQLILSGVQPQPMAVLFKAGFVDKIGLDNICPNIDASLVRARAIIAQPARAEGETA